MSVLNQARINSVTHIKLSLEKDKDIENELSVNVSFKASLKSADLITFMHLMRNDGSRAIEAVFTSPQLEMPLKTEGVEATATGQDGANGHEDPENLNDFPVARREKKQKAAAEEK